MPCLECGAMIVVQGFCCTECRKTWNNRRAVRGAQLYDLFMAARFDRPVAKALKVWRYLAHFASQFREEDRIERAGRRSWRDPAEIIARHGHLRADTLVQRRAA